MNSANESKEKDETKKKGNIKERTDQEQTNSKTKKKFREGKVNIAQLSGCTNTHSGQSVKIAAKTKRRRREIKGK